MHQSEQRPEEVKDVNAIIEAALRKQSTALEISGMHISEIPESIKELKFVKTLRIQETSIKAIPDSIGELRQLESLEVQANQNCYLPNSLGELKNLKSLSLSGISPQSIPSTIAQLSRLEYLTLTRCNVNGLPNFIKSLLRLKVIDVSQNKITRLPSWIELLTKLEELDLSYNNLNALPVKIGRLTNLIYLGLYHNRLKTLPPSFSSLKCLKRLFLSHNALHEFPSSILELAQLEALSIGGNFFNKLPHEISKLLQLTSLDVSRSREQLAYNSRRSIHMVYGGSEVGASLVELPETLMEIKSLSKIYLHGNSELGIPEEILGRNPAEDSLSNRKKKTQSAYQVLGYYFRTRGGKQPLNEAKLILVGRGEVGKTSLVNRLVHDKFRKGEKKTEGIQITSWDIEVNGGEQVKLNVWDFGGQEIMHSTHQFFLTHRSLYLLVLNGREGGEDLDADYWLKLIESFGNESPVIVVLNKIKEHPFDLNRRALQKKYPVIRDFIKTDCETGIGIAELHRAIQRETDRLEHLRDAFPASWFTIKNKLSGMRKNYLSFDDYRKLCKQLGEVDVTAQEALASYLHSLGIALNYKDDPRLQDTHVLNPHWVTNGIYKILNSEMLEQNKGDLRLEDIPDILDERKYPPHMHRFLLDLMKKFELCFTFPDNDCHYLIPDLLDKQEAHEASEFQSQKCLNFEYHYPVTPEGLLPRFIVRTHVLSNGLPRWRTGVVLKFDGNKALVKADLPDKKIHISISGPRHSRRRLLAIIRSDFEHIHGDIRLKPVEMVTLPDHPDVTIPYQELSVLEANGAASFPKVIGEEVVNLNVKELLNGVDIQKHRKGNQLMFNEFEKGLRLFYSYSHKDEHLRDELETHLKLLQRQGLLETWHDRKIEAGQEWDERIDENLEYAHIILLLISADFIASDYCYEAEMDRALERHNNGDAVVIPVIVRDVVWANAPFAKLQALPKDGKAVTTWDNRDSAWRNVAEGIHRVVQRRLTYKSPNDS